MTEFEPIVGRKFNLRMAPAPGWNGVTDCEVLAVEPYRTLAYSWNSSGEEAENGLKTVVTWTLTPTRGGTLVRMEQSGFRPEDEANYRGANYGWQRYLAGLDAKRLWPVRRWLGYKFQTWMVKRVFKL